METQEDVRARELHAMVMAARIDARVKRRRFQVVFWSSVSSFAFGLAWPVTWVAALLISSAAVGFIAATILATHMDRADSEVARRRLDAER